MQPNWQVDAHLEVQVPMRDGVNLSTDVYLPKAAGPFPTVLMRTPYSNNMDVYIRKARGLANDGYACVVQDVRGRWDSDGEFYPQAAERNDGYDTQEWIGSQAWSSGKIGMSGRSYLGAVQWLSAPLRSRYLTCLAPQSANSNPLGDLVRPGGAFQLGVLVTWGMRTTTRTSQSIAYENFTETFNTLPLIDLAKRAGRPLPFWSDWLQRPSDDPFWAEISTTTRWDQISVPAFNMGGWYDLYSAQAFRHFNGLRQQGRTPEARQSKLLVGPWPHHLGTDLSTSPRTGDIDFGAHSAISMDSVERRWFDYWLKGIANGIVDEPPLRLFIMGINEWRDEHEWPLARTDWQGWCLHSGGGAQSARGDGTLSLVPPADEPADTFEYDPALSGPDRRRRQLLLAGGRAVGAIRPATGGIAQRRAVLHQRPTRDRRGSDRARQARSACRDGRSGHGLDRQIGGCRAQWLCDEPVRRHHSCPLSRRADQSRPVDPG